MIFYIILAIFPLALLLIESVLKRTFSIYIYFVLFILLGLIGGLRNETGVDWEAYELYFENINIKKPAVEEYFSNLINLKFEFGYYLLNYYLKLIGLNYHSVFLISSLFSTFTIFCFARKIKSKFVFVIFGFLGYSFLILNFAQVRQAFSVGFFLLVCIYYLRDKSKIYVVFFSLMAILFQFSSLIYLVLAWSTLYIKTKSRLILLFLILLIFITFKINAYTLLKLITPYNLASKIETYEQLAETSEGGMGQPVLGFILLFTILFLLTFLREAKSSTELIILKYSLYSLSLTVLLIFVFPTNYVMFSRVYLVASLFQSFHLSIAYSRRSNFSFKLYAFFTIILNLTFYFRILTINSEFYTPYKSVITNAFQ